MNNKDLSYGELVVEMVVYKTLIERLLDAVKQCPDVALQQKVMTIFAELREKRLNA